MNKHIIPVFILIALLQGCAGFGQSFKNLGKSDIDMVTDINIEKLNEYIKILTVNLYEKNPQELAKNPHLSIEQRLTQILEYPTNIAYKEIDYKQSTEALELTFNREYKNDRVFSLMLGISSMIRFSYDNKTEVFLLHKLDPQKLYDSARNLERIIRRLRIESEHGKPLLNLGAVYGEGSFEDMITRMISIQDVMAKVIASKTDRILNQVIHGTATILIPIPL